MRHCKSQRCDELFTLLEGLTASLRAVADLPISHLALLSIHAPDRDTARLVIGLQAFGSI